MAPLGELAICQKGAFYNLSGAFGFAAGHGGLDILIFYILKICNILVSLNLSLQNLVPIHPPSNSEISNAFCYLLLI